MTMPLCGKVAALAALLLGTLSLGTAASAASLAGTQSVEAHPAAAGTVIEPVGYRGWRGRGIYLSIGPGYYRDYGYGPVYGYPSYGYAPRYGRYDYDDDDYDDDDDDGYYPGYYHRGWVRERFEHPLGRR
jgi:hypothetical protein